MTDVLLHQTKDDGEVTYRDGDLVMDGGLRTSVYLALFGSNRDDTGFANTEKSWWANFEETDIDKKYRGELQALLDALPLTSNNLLRFEDAAKQDLQEFVDQKAANTVTVVASIPAVNTLQLTIDIDDVSLIFVEQIDDR